MANKINDIFGSAMQCAIRYCLRVGQDALAHPLYLGISVIALSVGSLAVALTVVLGGVATDALVAKSEQRTARATTFGAAVSRVDPQSTWGSSFHDYDSALHRRGADGLLVGEASLAVYDGAKATRLSNQVYWGSYNAVRRVPALVGSWPSFEQAYPPVVAVSSNSPWKINEQISIASSAGGSPVHVRVSARVADGLPNPTVYIPGALCETVFYVF